MIVDDHPVVREGLRGMIDGHEDITVVGEAGSGDEAVVRARELTPDVVLMDLRMPGGDGVGATSRILAGQPAARVIVLTTYETDQDIVRAVEAGAAGYLLKDTSRADLLGAIKAAARGETVLSPSVATRLVTRMRAPVIESLSPRERGGTVSGGTRTDQRGDRPGVVHQRDHREDPSPARVRQAGCLRPDGRRHHGAGPGSALSDIR